MGMLYKTAGILFALILLLTVRANAITDVMEGAEVQAHPETVKEILATFDRAEKALRTENIDGIMAVYSKNYKHRGLRKVDTSRIWKDILERYDRLSSQHVFTKIVVEQKTPGKALARVSCTGALFGVLVKKKEGKPKANREESFPLKL